MEKLTVGNKINSSLVDRSLYRHIKFQKFFKIESLADVFLLSGLAFILHLAKFHIMLHMQTECWPREDYA